MKKTVLALLVPLIAGCATAQVEMYQKSHYPATDPQSVEVFRSKPQGKDFIEIGRITVDNATGWKQVDRIFKIKAAEYGGNAVYVSKTTEETATYLSQDPAHFYETTSDFQENRYHPESYYPHDYYYSYGFDPVDFAETKTATFLTVVGIVIRYRET